MTKNPCPPQRRHAFEQCRVRHPVASPGVVGLGGLEPPASPLSGVRSNHLSYRPVACSRIPRRRPCWWSQSGSNRRPPACKAGALPAELWPQASLGHRYRAFARCSECRCLVRMPDRTVSHTLKEVIQPHLPIRLPCYDFTPVIGHTVASAPLAVRRPASGATHSHGVTGGVYKARERIHRSNADLRLLAIPTSRSRVADSDPDYDVLFGFRLLSRGRFPLYTPL